jgi:hypothetical protein
MIRTIQCHNVKPAMPKNVPALACVCTRMKDKAPLSIQPA